MEFLSKLFVQTRAHLTGLSLSQRLAIASCVAVIAISLVWLTGWASEPDRVPLLDQPMSPEEVTQIQTRLDAVGVDYTLKGERIMVPASKRSELLAQLSEQRLLPDDISLGFTKILEESSPWGSMQEKDRGWSVATGNELARVLRKFKGVRDARVFIDKVRQRGFGQQVVPTASVGLTLHEGVSLEEGAGRAAASFVSSAVAGLDVYNVTVTDSTNLQSYSVRRPEQGEADDDFKDRKAKERHYTDQIKSLLTYIPGVQVMVYADLSPESQSRIKTEYDKPIAIEERSESTTSSRGMVAAGPGVEPNTEAGFSSRTPADNMDTSITETNYKGEVGVTETRTNKPRHDILGFSVSVNVPRSYLVSVLVPDDAKSEPTDDELDTLSSKLLAKIEGQIATGLKIDDERVQVDWFPDMGSVFYGGTGGVMQAGAGEGVMTLVGAYWDKAGMAVLAVVSLFMMLMMVRKVGEGPVLPGEEAPDLSRTVRKKRPEPEIIETAEIPVGEAQEREQLLVGKELDEATVRTQQVIAQVRELIEEDADASVAILQRWVNQGS